MSNVRCSIIVLESIRSDMTRFGFQYTIMILFLLHEKVKSVFVNRTSLKWSVKLTQVLFNVSSKILRTVVLCLMIFVHCAVCVCMLLQSEEKIGHEWKMTRHTTRATFITATCWQSTCFLSYLIWTILFLFIPSSFCRKAPFIVRAGKKTILHRVCSECIFVCFYSYSLCLSFAQQY